MHKVKGYSYFDGARSENINGPSFLVSEVTVWKFKLKTSHDFCYIL